MTILPLSLHFLGKGPIGKEMKMKTKAPRKQNHCFCTSNQLFSAFSNFVFAQVPLLNQDLLSF